MESGKRSAQSSLVLLKDGTAAQSFIAVACTFESFDNISVQIFFAALFLRFLEHAFRYYSLLGVDKPGSVSITFSESFERSGPALEFHPVIDFRTQKLRCSQPQRVTNLSSYVQLSNFRKPLRRTWNFRQPQFCRLHQTGEQCHV